MPKAMTVRLSEDVYQQVKSEARTTGRSMNSVINDAATKFAQNSPNTIININTLNNYNGPVNYNMEPPSQYNHTKIYDVSTND